MVNLLLNACEFAEHDEKVLPIDPKMLGRYALQHRAFAKALHYKELEWFTDASADVLKALINVNSKLQQPDTAWGVLNYARNDEERFDHAEFEYEKWYVELNEWKEAYAAFERKAAPGEEDGDIIFGKMKCLHALGEWDQLSDFAQSRWGQVGAAEHRTMAPLAAAAAWALKQWDLMEDYVAVMRKDSPDYFFYRAVISIHANQYSRSLKYINKARDSVDPELHSLFEESYSRAYKWVPSSLCWGSISTDAYIPLSCQCSHPNSDAVRARRDCCLQAERRSAGSPGDNAQDVDEEVRSARARVRSPRANIFSSFPHRLKGCEQDVEIWQRILSVRSLVLTPSQDKEMWIKFANLCRKSDRLGLAEKTLNSLLGPQDSSAPEGVSLVFHPCLYYALLTLPTPSLLSQALQAPPHVVYAYFKFTWAQGSREETLIWLRSFTAKLTSDLGLSTADTITPPEAHSEYTRLLARCYLKQGQWEALMKPDWISVRLALFVLQASTAPFLTSYSPAPDSRHRYSPVIQEGIPARPELVQSLAHMGACQLCRHPESRDPAQTRVLGYFCDLCCSGRRG